MAACVKIFQVFSFPISSIPSNQSASDLFHLFLILHFPHIFPYSQAEMQSASTRSQQSQENFYRQIHERYMHGLWDQRNASRKYAVLFQTFEEIPGKSCYSTCGQFRKHHCSLFYHIFLNISLYISEAGPDHRKVLSSSSVLQFMKVIYYYSDAYLSSLWST